MKQSLESLLRSAGDTVRMLRNSPIGAYVYPVVPTEFSNWRDEQVAWRTGAVLFDQSHHMAEITIQGPDALRLCSYATINSFANFVPGKAKQMIPVNHDGFVIGDGILFHLEKDELLFVGRAPTVNWLQFHAETGGFDVKVIRDDRSPSQPNGRAVTRRHFRYQVQGPRATQVLEKLNGGPLPDIRFFNFQWITIAGRKVRAHREWLPAAGYEGTGSLGGSFVSSNIEDYYLTPLELGYGPFLKFDHEFFGREALEQRVRDARPHRRKVTFEWNGDDLGRILASLSDRENLPCKFFDLPIANYASSSYDKVMLDDRLVGLSMFTGYSHNDRCGLSLGVLDSDIELGSELTLVWGEENGGTKKPTVERHRQCEVRVKVAPAPYSRDARDSYHAGWRSRQR